MCGYWLALLPFNLTVMEIQLVGLRVVRVSWGQTALCHIELSDAASEGGCSQ